MPNHPNRGPKGPFVAPAGWALHTISPQELRELIAAAGITQSEAARRCHAGERTMRDWVLGARRMPISASECLALSLMWPGQSRLVHPTVMLCERWIRPQFAGLIISLCR